MQSTPEETTEITQTPAQKVGISGKSIAKLYNYLADAKFRTVEELHVSTDVKASSIPSFLRQLRQKGHTVNCKREHGKTYYQLLAPVEL